jgi:uncharacterized protein (TIGR02145 family)
MKIKFEFWVYQFTLLGLVFFLAHSCKKDESENGIKYNPHLTYGTVTDIDLNVYKTIAIGSQIWMAENLKVTHFRNGDPIPETRSLEFESSGVWYLFDNFNDYAKIFGRLYNEYAAIDSLNVAPIGWHVATDTDWTLLTEFLGGEKVAGSKLKEVGNGHWNSTNTNATNESGFTALPGGFYSWRFVGTGQYSAYWSPSGNLSGCNRFISGDSDSLGRILVNHSSGLSIRCVKD